MTVRWTADGGVEFIGTDDDENERRIKLLPNDDGTFTIETAPPDSSNGKSVTIDPVGGNTSLGK